MTVIMWLEFAAIIAVVIVISWAGARFDIACMQRQARKQAERQRLLNILKRAE
jgi:phage portal protein BeeE